MMDTVPASHDRLAASDTLVIVTVKHDSSCFFAWCFFNRPAFFLQHFLEKPFLFCYGLCGVFHPSRVFPGVFFLDEQVFDTFPEFCGAHGHGFSHAAISTQPAGHVYSLVMTMQGMSVNHLSNASMSNVPAWVYPFWPVPRYGGSA